MEDFGKGIIDGFEKEVKRQKMIAYAKYAACVVVLGAAGYAAYKINKNLSEINESLKNIERGATLTAPNTDVVDL